MTLGMAEAALKMQGIDNLGLSEQDRSYLNTLNTVYAGGPVGADAMAATLGLKADTIAGVIEPYLIRTGLVVRTHRGRKTTDAAASHLLQHSTPA